MTALHATIGDHPGGRGRAGSDPIGFALLLAAALHAALIIGVGFVPEDRTPKPRPRQDLKIILIPPPEQKPSEPVQTDLLAQANNVGSGQIENIEPALRPTQIAEPEAERAPALEETAPPPPAPAALPLPAPPSPPPPPAPEKADRAPATPAKHGPSVPTATRPTPKPRDTPRKPPKPEPPAVQQSKPRVSAAQLLASRSDEIARLTAELERKSAAYAQRTKRKAISASTREYKYASYMEDWRRKVERIGNLNYPDEAKRKKLYGNLLLHVAVRADGTLEQVRILKSSGHKLLDDAAMRIVRMAAPYAPFPPDIRKEVDVLDITRTWQFLNSNRLGWKN